MLRSVPRTLAAALVLAAVVPTVACLPEVVVRLRTVVFHDASLERTIEVAGRPADPDEVPGPGWLAREVGIELAAPDAWDRVEVGDDRITASGFFAAGSELPPVLRLRTDAGPRPDRLRTEVAIDERTLRDASPLPDGMSVQLRWDCGRRGEYDDALELPASYLQGYLLAVDGYPYAPGPGDAAP